MAAELVKCPVLQMKDRVRFWEAIWWLYMAPAADRFVLSQLVKLHVTLDGSGC